VEKLELGEDEGFVEVVAADGATVRLDVYETQNRIADYYNANKDRPAVEYNQGFVEVLVGMGLPSCSFHTAAYFADRINARVLELKKKRESWRESHASTT